VSARYVVNCDWCGDLITSWPLSTGEQPNWNTDLNFPLKGHFCKNCLEAAYTDPLLSAAFQRIPLLAEERIVNLQRGKGPL
jgi:hypothetical protein